MPKPKIPIDEYCSSINIPLRTFYYWKAQVSKNEIEEPVNTKNPPTNKLSDQERSLVKSALLNPKYVDLSISELYYKLLDEEGIITGSVSTMHRIARQENLLAKRVKTGQNTPLNRETPVLVARGINEVWSWDVSQIKTFIRTVRLYLYVIIDIWSRFVVGWCIKDHEISEHAIEMWKKALLDQLITGDGLINHKDNGSIMRSKEMLKFVRDSLMIDSYSRAGVSDDNPFSESLFRTIKYFRKFPVYFETEEEAVKYFTAYFLEYNYEHRHSGIQFLAPAQRHYGDEEKILKMRNQIIEAFYSKNRHRYSSRHKVFKPILEVKIN